VTLLETGLVRPFEVTHRGVLAIAIPMTLAYLTTPLVGVVNLGVIGQLADPALVGGVSIGALVFDFVFVTFNFLRSGTTGLVAQAFGADDRHEVVATFFRALIIAIVVGLAVLLLKDPLLALALRAIGGSEAVQAATADYWHVRVLATPFALTNYVVLGWLIGLGRAGYGLLLQTILNGLNIVLSIVFVHSMGLGVPGVGWASFAAETATAVLGVIVVLALMDHGARPSRAQLLARVAFTRLFALNRDIMIRSFTLLFAFAFFTAQSAAAGDVVLAANEILLNLTIVAAFFLDGLAAAAEQLAGRAVGARYRPAFERSFRLVVFWGIGVALAVSLLLWFAGPAIVDLMTTSDPVRQTARTFLIWAALFPIIGTLAYQFDGIFIGATWSRDMRNMMLLSVLAFLVAWFSLTPFFGNHWLWMALLVFLSARSITLYWRMRRLVPLTFPSAL
jgi:multidrug resistance protein, MATE family